MKLTVLFVLAGYLSGSVLYAYVFADVFGKEHMMEESRDNNPGASNAFLYGGFWCGVCTLCCDIFKGFLPVRLFTVLGADVPAWAIAPVLAAPAVGHIFSVFHRFHGGKGIAVTFGCLLGLYPCIKPFLFLAGCFLFLSTVVVISPNFYRTLAAYLGTLVALAVWPAAPYIWYGFFVITGSVFVRFMRSSEKKERIRVKLL